MRRRAAKVQRRAWVSPPDGRSLYSSAQTRGDLTAPDACDRRPPERRFISSSLEIRYLVAEKIEDIVPMIETAAAKATVHGTREEIVDPRL